MCSPQKILEEKTPPSFGFFGRFFCFPCLSSERKQARESARKFKSRALEDDLREKREKRLTRNYNFLKLCHTECSGDMLVSKSSFELRGTESRRSTTPSHGNMRLRLSSTETWKRVLLVPPTKIMFLLFTVLNSVVRVLLRLNMRLTASCAI